MYTGGLARQRLRCLDHKVSGCQECQEGITYTGGVARQRAPSSSDPVERMASPCRAGQGREQNLMNDNDFQGGSGDD